MDWLIFVGLVVTGSVAVAEVSGSIIFRLVSREVPHRYLLDVQQRLIRVFDLFTVTLVTIAFILVALYSLRFAQNGPANRSAWASVFCFGCGLAITIWVNLPLNELVRSWHLDDLPPGWEKTRLKWEAAGVLRALLLMAGFVLFCQSVALHAAER